VGEKVFARRDELILPLTGRVSVWAIENTRSCGVTRGLRLAPVREGAEHHINCNRNISMRIVGTIRVAS